MAEQCVAYYPAKLVRIMKAFQADRMATIRQNCIFHSSMQTNTRE
jgi:hypothetical protein